MLHDAYCREVTERYPGALVAWWIMAAWAYEVAAAPILSDAMFDQVAARLDREWDAIEHPHKRLLERPALKSALAIGDRWPAMAIGAAMRLIAAEVSPPPIPAAVVALREIAPAPPGRQMGFGF